MKSPLQVQTKLELFFRRTWKHNVFANMCYELLPRHPNNTATKQVFKVQGFITPGGKLTCSKEHKNIQYNTMQ